MAQSTRLHLRFAAATAAVIATAGGALLWYVKHQEVRQAERNVTAQARYVEKSVLRDELAPADLARPVSGARLKVLDSLFNGRVLVDGGLRVKIYRAGDGLVTYSNIHSLIGTKIDSLPELREVLGGAIVRDVSFINHEGGTGKNVKALEVYVPLQLRGGAKPAGVFEIYQSYAPVASAIRSFRNPSGPQYRRSRVRSIGFARCLPRGSQLTLQSSPSASTSATARACTPSGSGSSIPISGRKAN